MEEKAKAAEATSTDNMAGISGAEASDVRQDKDSHLSDYMQVAGRLNVVRIGDKFEKTSIAYDIYGRPFVDYVNFTKETLIDDYGKDFIYKVKRYDRAVIVPNHVNYRLEYGNCINRYHKLEKVPQKGKFKTWIKLLKRVFGNQWRLGLTYLLIAYQKPTQVLPVLCLVSPENNTGKSTFGNALQFIFGLNVGFFGQDDLSSQFNTWLMKLFAVFEEISETKNTLNKIKNFSTAKSATVNAKYKQQMAFQPFVKLIILTNNEASFVKANQHDIRYWIRKLEPIKDFDPLFDEKLEAEAPAFMWLLENMKIPFEKKSRMYFSPEMIHTAALDKVRQESRSDVEKDLEEAINEKFAEFDSFYARGTDMVELLNRRYTLSKICSTLKEMGYNQVSQRRCKNLFGNEINGTPFYFSKRKGIGFGKEENNTENDGSMPF